MVSSHRHDPDGNEVEVIASEAVVLRLATIAAHVEELLASEQPLSRAPVGLQSVKTDRRRAMERVLLLLADPEVRGYLDDLRRRGLVAARR